MLPGTHHAQPCSQVQGQGDRILRKTLLWMVQTRTASASRENDRPAEKRKVDSSILSLTTTDRHG
jgi:hypothetical protein